MGIDVVGIVLGAMLAVTVAWLLFQRGKGNRPPS
jgi:hypothetical protein